MLGYSLLVLQEVMGRYEVQWITGSVCGLYSGAAYVCILHKIVTIWLIENNVEGLANN